MFPIPINKQHKKREREEKHYQSTQKNLQSKKKINKEKGEYKSKKQKRGKIRSIHKICTKIFG